MAATTARTKQDVDNMTRDERLWDSLNYSYGRQREASDKAYNQAYSQADRQALSRGMQRSAYNAQNLANINQQKLEAQENSWNTQIADYENRLGQLEQQELENERWEKEFAANREDAQWNKDFQKQQADTANNQWNLQFNANREDTQWNKDFQKEQADLAKDQWNQQFAASRDDTAWNQAFQQGQADISQDQWEREFGYNTASNEKQIAMQWAMNILSNGEMPSDDILTAAGLSREDAAKMKAKKSGGSGKGGSKTSPDAEGLLGMLKNGAGNGQTPANVTDETLLMDQLYGELSSKAGAHEMTHRRTENNDNSLRNRYSANK